MSRLVAALRVAVLVAFGAGARERAVPAPPTTALAATRTAHGTVAHAHGATRTEQRGDHHASAADREAATSLIAKIAYWMTKRRLGKVMTPMKVVYARMPALFRLAYEEVKIDREASSASIPTVSILVRTWVAMINELQLLRRHREGGRRSSAA